MSVVGVGKQKNNTENIVFELKQYKSFSKM